jgi:hypothetical protein
MSQDVNEAQTETLDGRLKFKESPVSDDFGHGGCHGCAVYGKFEENLPCSPGTRNDGKSGIWVTTTAEPAK